MKQIDMKPILWMLALCCGASPGTCPGQTEPATAAMVINSGTPWVVADGQPEAMQRALLDVGRDWYKVFGRRPVVVKEVPASYKGPVIHLGLTGSWRGKLVKEPFAGPESFLLRAQRDEAGRPALVGTGADMRGSIYAAYALSEEILGVDPWYYWVDKEPAARTTIAIPAGFDKRFGSPTFKYRGWFINDEDLLARFAPDPLRENVFSLEMFDRIYETILRLRGNMVVPATFPFPDERCQELAARRGLVLNMHHILVLGLNTFRWPKDVPFSFSKHPEIMDRYWQACIDAYKDYEVVWTVGYRGKHDQPFWTDEPDLKTPEERGDVITRAIARQVELVRKVHSDAPMIANMWSEGAELYHQGLIKIPDGVTLVWPDNGSGIIQDKGTVKPGQGIYYHTAMLNGACNQLTEMVNPGRIYNQVGRFTRAGATGFFLVNVSDIRPVPLSTDCAMKLAWDAKPYLGKSDEQNMTAFLEDWSRRQFGAEAAAEISGIYREYFATSYMDDTGLKGENWLHRKVRHLHEMTYPLVAAGKPLGDEATKLRAELLRFSSGNLAYMEKLLAKAEKLLPVVPAGRRDFYQSHVLTQIRIHLKSLAVLEAGCQAMAAYGEGDKPRAAKQQQMALETFDKIYQDLRKAEYGKWAGWYEGECLMALEWTRGSLENMLATLRGEPEPVKSARWQDYDYAEIYQYQERFSKNFPLLYPGKKEQTDHNHETGMSKMDSCRHLAAGPVVINGSNLDSAADGRE
jgi:hypothetical protein